MKRALAAVLVLLITVISPSFTSAAGVIDEQYSINSGGRVTDKVGVLFEENVDTLRMPTLLFGSTDNRDQPSGALEFCTGIDDPICSTAPYLRYFALLPPCKSLTEVDCIESVYAVVPGSSARINGIFRESIPEKVVRAYKADLKNGLPQGSNAGVWEIPNVKHGGNTTEYVAIVSRVGAIKREGTKWTAAPAGKFSGGGDFRAAIYPTTLVRDSRYKANVAEITEQSWGKSTSIKHPSQFPFDVCAIIDDGVCAMRQPFPENVQFGMVIRFSKVINGWMHGRIDSPEIDYKLTSYGTRVDMKGSATRVPILSGWVDPAEFSDEVKGKYPQDTQFSTPGRTSTPGASGDRAMETLGIWSKALKETAAAYPSQWIFYNLPDQDIARSNSCIKSSKTLAGFVTTNSTTYTATPPIYNRQTGTLDYKVASPHFLPDGKVFLGKYNLYIDSKVARCIYKFSNAPISASVSITSSDVGQQTIATTVVGERGGWLHLSASGFTFSSPTLKVKLTQSAQSTITCVKGKTIKKVTANSPKCPTGYKKKA